MIIKKCPNDRILVITNRQGKFLKYVHGKNVFIPFFRKYAFLDLCPIPLYCKQEKFQTSDSANLIIDLSATIAIHSYKKELISLAAEKLLYKKYDELMKIGENILREQLKSTIVTFTVEYAIFNRNSFLNTLVANLELALSKYGFRLININIADMIDDVGIVEALGREAARVAIEKAKTTIAARERAALDAQTDK